MAIEGLYLHKNIWSSRCAGFISSCRGGEVVYVATKPLQGWISTNTPSSVFYSAMIGMLKYFLFISNTMQLLQAPLNGNHFSLDFNPHVSSQAINKISAFMLESLLSAIWETLLYFLPEISFFTSWLHTDYSFETFSSLSYVMQAIEMATFSCKTFIWCTFIYTGKDTNTVLLKQHQASDTTLV